ncbi:hypothetical protein LCGC14_2643500, partial [marine sediment metagenome]
MTKKQITQHQKDLITSTNKSPLIIPPGTGKLINYFKPGARVIVYGDGNNPEVALKEPEGHAVLIEHIRSLATSDYPYHRWLVQFDPDTKPVERAIAYSREFIPEPVHYHVCPFCKNVDCLRKIDSDVEGMIVESIECTKCDREFTRIVNSKEIQLYLT